MSFDDVQKLSLHFSALTKRNCLHSHIFQIVKKICKSLKHTGITSQL